MTDLRKAAEMALKVLEAYRGQINIYGASPAADACDALRAALEQENRRAAIRRAIVRAAAQVGEAKP